jgi:hypothetical protein
MNTKAIEPISDAIPPRAATPAPAAATTTSTTASTASAAPAAAQAPAAAAQAPAARPVAIPITPAATVSVTQIPASVAPEDRALYLQILASVGGDSTAALEVLRARQNTGTAVLG